MTKSAKKYYVEMKLREKVQIEQFGKIFDTETPTACVGVLFVYESTRLPKLLDENAEFIEIQLKDE